MLNRYVNIFNVLNHLDLIRSPWFLFQLKICVVYRCVFYSISSKRGEATQKIRFSTQADIKEIVRIFPSIFFILHRFITRLDLLVYTLKINQICPQWAVLARKGLSFLFIFRFYSNIISNTLQYKYCDRMWRSTYSKDTYLKSLQKLESFIDAF